MAVLKGTQPFLISWRNVSRLVTHLTVSNQRNALTGALKLHFRCTYVFCWLGHYENGLGGLWAVGAKIEPEAFATGKSLARNKRLDRGMARSGPLAKKNPGFNDETWATHSKFVRVFSFQ